MSPCRFFCSLPFQLLLLYIAVIYSSYVTMCRFNCPILTNFASFLSAYFQPQSFFLIFFFFRSKLSTLERLGSVCRGRSLSWSSLQISPRSNCFHPSFPQPLPLSSFPPELSSFIFPLKGRTTRVRVIHLRGGTTAAAFFFFFFFQNGFFGQHPFSKQPEKKNIP